MKYPYIIYIPSFLLLLCLTLTACSSNNLTQMNSPIATKTITNTFNVTDYFFTPSITKCQVRQMIKPSGNLLIEKNIENMGIASYAFFFHIDTNTWNKISSDDLPIEKPSLSHNKQKLIFIFSDTEKYYIYLQDINNIVDSNNEETSTRILYGGKGQIISTLKWDKNDEWIIFAATIDHYKSDIILFNTITGENIKINTISTWNNSPEWMPNTNTVVFLGGEDEYRANAIYMIAFEDIIHNKYPELILENYLMYYFDGVKINHKGQMIVTIFYEENKRGILIYDNNKKEIRKIMINNNVNIDSGNWSINGEYISYRNIAKIDSYIITMMVTSMYSDQEWVIESWSTQLPGEFSYIWEDNGYGMVLIKAKKIEESNNGEFFIEIVNVKEMINTTNLCDINKIEFGPFISFRLIIHNWIK